MDLQNQVCGSREPANFISLLPLRAYMGDVGSLDQAEVVINLLHWSSLLVPLTLEKRYGIAAITFH